MTAFTVGDKVRMHGVPITVEVLEVANCDDTGPGGPCGEPTFRIADPETGEDDWVHARDFERVS